MFEDPDLLPSFHESGHCAIGLLQGREILEMTVIPTETSRANILEIRGEPRPLEEELVYLLGGTTAEIHLCRGYDRFVERHGPIDTSYGDSDAQKIVELLRHASLTKDEEARLILACVQEARRLIGIYWEDVRLLAGMLLNKRIVIEAEIELLSPYLACKRTQQAAQSATAREG